ncbi:MAG TPA: DinB family protein [Cyclobacteriaceae bacterium]
MNIFFQPIFNELEQQRHKLIDLVKDLPTEKFNYVPSPDKWSIAQILTHILVAERLSIVYMRKKSQGIDQLKDSGFTAQVRLVLLKISQRIPTIKFKAPKVVLENTPAALSVNELVAAWEKQRNDLKTFLEGIGEKNIKKEIYKHVIAGRLDARQAMIFLREHANHHWPQIKRLLEQNP